MSAVTQIWRNALTHLTFSCLRIDQECLQSISQCSKLQHLELSCPDFDRLTNMANINVNVLANLGALKTLKLSKLDNKSAELMDILCQADSIREIRIAECKIGNYIATVLRRFNGLRILEVIDSKIIANATELTSLEIVTIKNCYGNVGSFVSSLPSATVKSFSLFSAGIGLDFDVMENVQSLHKLRQLHIEYPHTRITHEDSSKLVCLSDLRELTITDDCFSWISVCILIQCCEHLKLIRLNHRHFQRPLSECLFNDLVASCRRQRRRLVIELNFKQLDYDFVMPEFFYANNNCNFVEIVLGFAEFE